MHSHAINREFAPSVNHTISFDFVYFRHVKFQTTRTWYKDNIDTQYSYIFKPEHSDFYTSQQIWISIHFSGLTKFGF